MTSSNTTTIYSPEYANSFKYLVDIRWNLLCLFNNISMKAQLFNNLCDKYEKQICEEILVGGYSNNNSFEEISRIYYILLEEALCLENHGCIEEKSPKKMSPNVFEISNKSRLNWKDKKEYRLCSRNQLLQFFAYLSLDKMSDVAAIAQEKFSSKLKDVHNAITSVIYHVKSSFERLVNAFADRGKPKKVKGHTFDVVKTETNKKGVFPSFKIIITKRIIGKKGKNNLAEENSHTFDFSVDQNTTNDKNTTDVMAVLNNIVNKYEVIPFYRGRVVFFELSSKEVFDPEPKCILYDECESYLRTDDYKVDFLLFQDYNFYCWRRVEYLLSYLREIRSYILCEYNKICSRVELFKQICQKIIHNTNSEKIILESFEIVDLFYSVLEDCLNLLEENDDINYPFDVVVFDEPFHYCNSVKCFQSLLNLIVKDFPVSRIHEMKSIKKYIYESSKTLKDDMTKLLDFFILNPVQSNFNNIDGKNILVGFDFENVPYLSSGAVFFSLKLWFQVDTKTTTIINFDPNSRCFRVKAEDVLKKKQNQTSVKAEDVWKKIQNQTSLLEKTKMQITIFGHQSNFHIDSALTDILTYEELKNNEMMNGENNNENFFATLNIMLTVAFDENHPQEDEKADEKSAFSSAAEEKVLRTDSIPIVSAADSTKTVDLISFIQTTSSTIEEQQYSTNNHSVVVPDDNENNINADTDYLRTESIEEQYSTVVIPNNENNINADSTKTDDLISLIQATTSPIDEESAEYFKDNEIVFAISDAQNKMLEIDDEKYDSSNEIFFISLINNTKDYFNEDWALTGEHISIHLFKIHNMISSIEAMNEQIFKMFFFHCLTKIDQMLFSRRDKRYKCLSENTVGWIDKESFEFFGCIKMDYLERALSVKSTSFMYFYIYKKFFASKKKAFKQIEQHYSTTHSVVVVDSKEDILKRKIQEWFENKPAHDDKNNSLLKALLNLEDKKEFEDLDKLSFEFERNIHRYNTTVKTIAETSKSRLAIFFEMVSSILSKNDLNQTTKLYDFLGKFRHKMNFIEKLKNFNLKTKTSTKSDVLLVDQPTTTTSSPRLDDIKVNSKVSKVYKLINEASGAIGGNSSHGPIYGEQTMGSFQKILNYLKLHCEFNNDSRFVDVGSGLGKPNFHVAQDPMVKLSIGIELHDVRFQLSIHNWKYIEENNKRYEPLVHLDNVMFIAGDIVLAKSLDPFTHVYMYDIGFPADSMEKIAISFNKSFHAKFLVSYHNNRKVKSYGFEVEFIHQLPTSMTGSGEIHTAYIYKRIPLKKSFTNNFTKNFTKSFSVENSLQKNELEPVYCDPFFFSACSLVFSPNSRNELKERVMKIAADYQTSGRGKRKRSTKELKETSTSDSNEDYSSAEEKKEKIRKKKPTAAAAAKKEEEEKKVNELIVEEAAEKGEKEEGKVQEYVALHGGDMTYFRAQLQDRIKTKRMFDILIMEGRKSLVGEAAAAAATSHDDGAKCPAFAYLLDQVRAKILPYYLSMTGKTKSIQGSNFTTSAMVEEFAVANSSSNTTTNTTAAAAEDAKLTNKSPHEVAEEVEDKVDEIVVEENSSSTTTTAAAANPEVKAVVGSAASPPAAFASEEEAEEQASSTTTTTTVKETPKMVTTEEDGKSNHQGSNLTTSAIMVDEFATSSNTTTNTTTAAEEDAKLLLLLTNKSLPDDEVAEVKAAAGSAVAKSPEDFQDIVASEEEAVKNTSSLTNKSPSPEDFQDIVVENSSSPSTTTNTTAAAEEEEEEEEEEEANPEVKAVVCSAASPPAAAFASEEEAVKNTSSSTTTTTTTAIEEKNNAIVSHSRRKNKSKQIIVFQDIPLSKKVLFQELLNYFIFDKINMEVYSIIIDLFKNYKEQYVTLDKFWNLQNKKYYELDEQDQSFYNQYKAAKVQNPQYRSALDQSLNIIEFASLAPGQLVNLDVINMYTIMLNCREASLRIVDEKRSKNFFVYPHSYLLPQEKNNDDINLYQFDNLISISNINKNHWIVVKIDMKKRIIFFYDSSMNKQKILTDSHSQLADKIKQRLLLDKNIQNAEDWNLEMEKTLKQQTNTVDCGIYAMINAYFVPDDFFIGKSDKIASIECLRFKIGMDFERGYLKDPRIKNNRSYLSLEKSNEFGGKPKTIQANTNFDPSKNPKTEYNNILDCNLPQSKKRKCSSSSSSSSSSSMIIIDLDDEKEAADDEEEENIGDEEAAIEMLEQKIKKQKIELERNEEKLNSLKSIYIF